MQQIIQTLEQIMRDAGVVYTITGQFVLPKISGQGDISLPCFELAKNAGKNPVEVAKEIQSFLVEVSCELIDRVEVVGPYVNFYLNAQAVAKLVLTEIAQEGGVYGSHTFGADKKVLVEFAHPNTHKAFHIGHLRNITTGESILRLLNNVGYRAVAVNYQGDVGMHIAKALWGITRLREEFEMIKDKSLAERVSFLGRAYALGGTTFETDESVQKEIIGFNEKIYTRDESISELYTLTRRWSLEYFDSIYARVGTRFERLFFESEVAERGKELVLGNVDTGIFEHSDGAVIFAGSKVGLHDRVFINSKGFPTYEGKEIGLAELQNKEFAPDEVIHITGREQSDYFKVVFAAIDRVFPELAGKERHISYGWVALKHGKMSSRTGNVVLGEWLLDEVEKTITEVMADREMDDKEQTIRSVALGAVKYAMLKTGVNNDISFDINESVSTTGDSGVYILYTTARIKSILRKMGAISGVVVPPMVEPQEHQLSLMLAQYPQVTERAATNHDPSEVAKYLFGLSQTFSSFYDACPVSQATGDVQQFRVTLIDATRQVLEHGLHLLGIPQVDKM